MIDAMNNDVPNYIKNAVQLANDSYQRGYDMGFLAGKVEGLKQAVASLNAAFGKTESPALATVHPSVQQGGSATTDDGVATSGPEATSLQGTYAGAQR